MGKEGDKIAALEIADNLLWLQVNVLEHSVTCHGSLAAVHCESYVSEVTFQTVGLLCKTAGSSVAR